MITETVKKIKRGIPKMFWEKASKKSKCKIAKKDLVIPQAGQEIPVTDLKIQVTGIFATISKNAINIVKIVIFFTLFIFLVS